MKFDTFTFNCRYDAQDVQNVCLTSIRLCYCIPYTAGSIAYASEVFSTQWWNSASIGYHSLYGKKLIMSKFNSSLFDQAKQRKRGRNFNLRRKENRLLKLGVEPHPHNRVSRLRSFICEFLLDIAD